MKLGVSVREHNSVFTVVGGSFYNIVSNIYEYILLGVLYGCETWSLILREERRLRVFENRVLRRIFGTKRDEVTGNGENYIIKSLMICTAHQILSG